MEYQILIPIVDISANLKNIDIRNMKNIDIDNELSKNIDIDNELSKNIDIVIDNRLLKKTDIDIILKGDCEKYRHRK